MEIYKTIKDWRKANFPTQIDAAEKLGIQQSTYSRIEKKTIKPGHKLTLKIERITGIPRQKLRPDIYPPERVNA